MHRWIAAIFMICVVITFFVLQGDSPPEWVNYLPLPALFLLMITGTYLFALPYFAKRGKTSGE